MAGLRAIVQKERAKKGEEGERTGESCEGKPSERVRTLGFRSTAQKGHVSQSLCFIDKERRFREVK